MEKNKNKKSVRLPTYIYPTSYNIRIHPDLLSFIFQGEEVISINILKTTNKITLHSKDIDIETASIKKGKKEIFSIKIEYDTGNETATIHLKDKIMGKNELHLSFSGIITESLRGFYKSKYIVDNEEKYIATTQFEATDARRAFPCFDEPSLKATFKISLIVSDKHSAISNTLPIEIKEHSDGYKIISFAETPKMSTYLLAFIIGEFEFIEEKAKISDSQEILVRVFTTKNKIHQAKFALDIAMKSLKFFTEYFDIPYPMSNLDLISIPDFEPAGMENWGAITFRESSLLIDEKHSSLTNKQWVATTIAHEIAHQWFGNLVTMHWWTDLWLNEGFASYMEKICTDNLFPHWNIWELQLGSGRFRMAIEIDSLKNSHPIEVDVHHPNEISETFDMVSYEKGTALIRMLSSYIGEENFRKGLKYYLKKHSFKNAKTINLWEAFEKVSKKPVRRVMNSWTKKAGFPLVIVDDSKLTQEKFFSSRVTRKENDKKELWQIPISYKSSNGLTNILMDKKKFPIDSILEVNNGGTSFIKVSYDKETLESLLEKIEMGHMNTIDRLLIARDLFSLAEGGYIKTNNVLSYALSFRNETEYVVWSELVNGFNKIYNLLNYPESENNFKNYCLSFLSPLANKMGFEKKNNESSSETLLRTLALSQAAFYGDKRVIREAKKIFAGRISNLIDPDIRSVIYNIIAQNGGKKEWKLLETLYKNETLNEEKERIGRSMAYFSTEDLLKNTLSFAISDNVKDQDAPFIIALTWYNKKGREATWKFIKDNWPLILNKYGESGGLLLSKLVAILGNHTTLKDLKDARKFFSKNKAPGAERTLEQAFERIESNIAWIKDDLKDIQKWLKKNSL